MTETLSQGSLERAADLILNADALIVAAGVGMGIDSRQPDLRGLVTKSPFAVLGGGEVDLSRLACREAWRQDKQFIPLYIGKAETIGKGAGSVPLSTCTHRWPDQLADKQTKLIYTANAAISGLAPTRKPRSVVSDIRRRGVLGYS